MSCFTIKASSFTLSEFSITCIQASKAIFSLMLLTPFFQNIKGFYLVYVSSPDKHMPKPSVSPSEVYLN